MVFIISLHWPSSAPESDRRNSRCTLMHAFTLIHTEDPDDHLAVFFSYDCCCWRNPLAILVIINYSKWINLTRHRTTKVIFEFVAEIYLPIKLTSGNVYQATDDGLHWNYTLWAFKKIFFSLSSQRQWRWRRRQWWRKMKLVRACVRVCVWEPTLD